MLAELGDLGLISLDLVALGIGALALLLNVESQVLKQDDAAVLSGVDSLLDLCSNTVLGEGDLAAEELLKLRNDRGERELGVRLAIGTTEMGHEDNGLGAILDGIFDGGDSADDTLGVGDSGAVKGDVEVDLGERKLMLVGETWDDGMK